MHVIVFLVVMLVYILVRNAQRLFVYRKMDVDVLLGVLVRPGAVPAQSQQALPRELDLARGLAGLEAALRDAHPLPLAELDLVLVRVPGARAVVREVHAREGVGAQVIVARC